MLSRFLSVVLPALLGLAGFPNPSAAEPAAQWTDASTGHRVLRISRAAGSSSLYFHQNSYTPQGDKMVISTPQGIAAVTLKDWTVKPLVTGDVKLLFTGRRTRTVFYTRPAAKGVTVFAADIDTGRERKIVDLPEGSIGSINADETLLLGQVEHDHFDFRPDGRTGGNPAAPARPGETDYRADDPHGNPLTYAEAKEVRLNARLEAKVPMEIFTLDIRTGARRVVTASTDWLNHIQFSPTDPQQIMYCHEGPWHKVDRIWTIRADGSGRTSVHTRMMNMEIAGHEFFSPDGKWIWYDLQTPRGAVFWLAGYEIATGKRTYYALDRNMWSVHYNQSPDGSRFTGDGGDPEMVAHAPDGKYLYLFKPHAIPDVAGIHAPNAAHLIAPGTLTAEKLVDMRQQNYRLEPNMTFTPDGRFIIFRGNFEGASHVYAVEVAKAH